VFAAQQIPSPPPGSVIDVPVSSYEFEQVARQVILLGAIGVLLLAGIFFLLAALLWFMRPRRNTRGFPVIAEARPTAHPVESISDPSEDS
jgi:hypothetical protein